MNTINLIGRRILFLGAHADDIEIGCAGSAAKFSAEGRTIAFAQAADCGPRRKAEARAAGALLGLSPERGNQFFGYIPDGRLEERKDVLRAWLADLLERFQPDTVYAHRPEDSHPDHAALFEGAMRTFANQSMLLYFVPKLGLQATPFAANYWEDITGSMERKLQLLAAHGSQSDKSIYVDPQHHRALSLVAYVTGFGRTGGYAEAFRIHAARSGHQE